MSTDKEKIRALAQVIAEQDGLFVQIKQYLDQGRCDAVKRLIDERFDVYRR